MFSSFLEKKTGITLLPETKIKYDRLEEMGMLHLTLPRRAKETQRLIYLAYLIYKEKMNPATKPYTNRDRSHFATTLLSLKRGNK